MQTIQIEKDDPQEHPISIGENTLSFIKNQTKLDDDGKTIVIDEAMNILKHCIVPGINSEITNIAIGTEWKNYVFYHPDSFGSRQWV